MKKRFYFSVALAAIFLFSICAAAQSPAKILKQATKALGDEKSLQNLKSFEKKGTIARLKDGASGAITIVGAQPNLYSVRYDLSGFETETSFNGKSGWTRNSRDGLRTLTGASSRDFQTEASFRNRFWLDYKREKAKITAGGKSTVGGKAANILNYATAKGTSVKLYFDAASGFLLREESSFGDAARTIDYADYRTIDGISEPFSIKEKIGEDTYEIKLESVAHNAPNVVAARFDFPKTGNQALPDIPALLVSLQTNQDKVDQILDTYSYTQKITSRAFDKDGVLRETESETVQLSFYKGNRLRRTVEKNGKPLTASEQADEDKNVQKRIAEIDKDIAKKEAKTAAQNASDAAKEDEDRRISIAELLRASSLINPRREVFRGREVIVFDFEPNPNFDYKNAKSFLKFFGKTAGVMWIDERDKQVARLEAVLANNFKIGGGILANLKKGASFVLEQERVGDEIWLPSSADINLSIKVLLVKGISVNQVVKSYDYRKFATEVKDAKVGN